MVIVLLSQNEPVLREHSSFPIQPGFGGRVITVFCPFLLEMNEADTVRLEGKACRALGFRRAGAVSLIGLKRLLEARHTRGSSLVSSPRAVSISIFLSRSHPFLVPWLFIPGCQVVLAIDLLLVTRVSQHADPLAPFVPS